MLKPGEAAKLQDAIRQATEKALSVTWPRKTNRDDEQLARDIYTANAVVSQAKAKLTALQKRALDIGLTFDHKEQPREPGQYTHYNGTGVIITLKVNEPATPSTLDRKAAITAMRKAGLNTKQIDAIVDVSTKQAAPAHNWRYLINSGTAEMEAQDSGK